MLGVHISGGISDDAIASLARLLLSVAQDEDNETPRQSCREPRAADPHISKRPRQGAMHVAGPKARPQ